MEPGAIRGERERKPYPGDLTDEQSAVVKHQIPPAWAGIRWGDLTQWKVLNALFYRIREGGRLVALPHHFSYWMTIYNYFQWSTEDRTRKILDAGASRSQPQTGRQPTPTVAANDSRSVKTAESGAKCGTNRASQLGGATGTSSWIRRAS